MWHSKTVHSSDVLSHATTVLESKSSLTKAAANDVRRDVESNKLATILQHAVGELTVHLLITQMISFCDNKDESNE